MTNSWQHMNMDLLHSVMLMANVAASIPACLHTLLTTQRSKYCVDNQQILPPLSRLCRVLLASVRDKGVCPCPRCLVRKSEIDKIGQKIDARNRLSKARQYIGNVIQSARRFIYTLGLNVHGAAVERLLFEQSLVPTRVSTFIYTH